MIPGVTVVIPTIPPRRQLLARALSSVLGQTRLPEFIVVTQDVEGIGAAANRNRGLAQVGTEWTAFLDDDDLYHPHHLEWLLAEAETTGADLVYPWFDGINCQGILATYVDGKPTDPYGVPFGAEQAKAIREKGNFIPITVLVRTELIQKVGGFTPPPWASPDNPCEDWGCWLKLLDAGARFAHLPKVTWRWMGHPMHTSGRLWQDVYPRAALR